MCPAGRRRPVVRPPSRQSVPAGTRRSRPRERRRDALLSSSIPPPFRGRRDRQRVRYRMATDRLPSRVVLEFHVLGPLEVVGEGGALRLGGPRQRATLAILLLQGNRVVPVERLADELYAGRPPVPAVTQVQRQISDLRRALAAADAIETRPPGYVLHLGDDDFDLARFERLTAMAERARAREDVEAAAGLLREALDLWRGPPLADLAYESFARAAVERLEELRLAALEARIDADLVLGRHAAVLRSSRASSPSTRCASASAASRCSRSTAREGRPRRSRSTA